MQLTKNINQGKYLLALHSTSETLGVGVHNLKNESENTNVLTFETGKTLSKNIFIYINKILPYNEWSQIERIGVAIGPGGFTGTRLSIAMARTIAQQLKCEVDGISSFSLMAKRLYKENKSFLLDKSFWITSPLKRRGLIGGQYKILANKSLAYCDQVLELKSPHLLDSETDISIKINADYDILNDTLELLKIIISAHEINKISPWENILPIYPTSPIDNY